MFVDIWKLQAYTEEEEEEEEEEEQTIEVALKIL